MVKRFQILAQNPKKLRNMIFGFEVILISIFLLTSLTQIPNQFVRYLFQLDQEFNIPALFSGAQLFFVGYGFLLLRNISNEEPSSSTTSLYKALGILFIYLSFDEVLMLHENLTLIFRNVDWIPKNDAGHGVWILPYIIIGLVFFIVHFKRIIMLLRLNPHETSIMGAGVFLFLLGALGFETNRWLFRKLDFATEIQNIIQLTSEEFLEMIGITIVFYGVLLLYQKSTESSHNISI